MVLLTSSFLSERRTGLLLFPAWQRRNPTGHESDAVTRRGRHFHFSRDSFRKSLLGVGAKRAPARTITRSGISENAEYSRFAKLRVDSLHSKMASRNGSNPADRRTTRRRLSQEVTSEDLVARQTEEVFQSYAFYRYQQEQEQREGDVPFDPEITAFHQESENINNQVGRRLAVIGDDINARYDKEFTEMLKSLQPSKDNAYEYFTRIASSLFDSGINWGRVIALLGFGYRMAIHVYQHGLTGFLRRIARYMADFVLHNRIARWIAQQGGWVAALELSNVYIKYVVIVAMVILLGQFVLRRFFSQ